MFGRARSLVASRSLRGAALAGLFARGINVLGSILLTPLAADRLPVAGFQEALVLLTLTAFAPLGDLGVGLAMLSMYPAAKSDDERRTLAATAYRMSTIGAGAIFAIGAALALTGIAPRVLFHADGAVPRLGVLILSSALAISIAANARLRILAAMRRQVEQNIHYSASYLAAYVAAIIGLELSPNLPLYLLTMTALPQILMLTTTVVRLKRIRPLEGAKPRKDLLRPIFANAGAITAQTIALTIAVQSDVILTSHILGKGGAAELALVNRVISAFMLVASVAFTPLWPVFAEALSNRDCIWIRHAVRRSLILGASGAAVFSVILFSVGRPATELLSSGLYQATWPYWAAGACWCFAMALHYPLAMLVNAAVQKRLQTLSFMAMLAVNLPMTVFLLPVLGPVAAIAANALSYTVCTVVPYAFYYRRLLSRASAVLEPAGPQLDG